MTQVDMTKMRKELIDDEGLKLSAYQDDQGFWTIGVGRLIDARRKGGLTLQEASVLLENDIQSCIKGLSTLPCWPDLTDARRRALINLRFQLGQKGLQSFGTFLALMNLGKYKEAGEDLRGTKWSKEVPARANRIIKMIEGD